MDEITGKHVLAEHLVKTGIKERLMDDFLRPAGEVILEAERSPSKLLPLKEDTLFLMGKGTGEWQELHDAGALPNESNPLFMFSDLGVNVLRAIADGEISADELQQLANIELTRIGMRPDDRD